MKVCKRITLVFLIPDDLHLRKTTRVNRKMESAKGEPKTPRPVRRKMKTRDYTADIRDSDK